MKKLLIFLFCMPQLAPAMYQSVDPFKARSERPHIAERKREILEEIIKQRIEDHSDLNVPMLSDRPPLVKAASSDENIDLTKLLLEKGANPNATGQKQLTALHNATRNLSVETVRLLLRNGAGPDPILHERHSPTPLTLICHGSYDVYIDHSNPDQGVIARKKIVKLLTNYRADVNKKRGYRRETPLDCLILAPFKLKQYPNYLEYTFEELQPILAQRKELITILIRSGGNIFSRDVFGQTALAEAQVRQNKAHVELANFAEAECKRMERKFITPAHSYRPKRLLTLCKKPRPCNYDAKKSRWNKCNASKRDCRDDCRLGLPTLKDEIFLLSLLI